MRAGLLIIALILILGGFAAISFPHQEFIGHAPTRYKGGSVEIVTAKQSVVYGWASVGLGVLLGAAVVALGKSLKHPRRRDDNFAGPRADVE